MGGALPPPSRPSDTDTLPLPIGAPCLCLCCARRWRGRAWCRGGGGAVPSSAGHLELVSLAEMSTSDARGAGRVFRTCVTCAARVYGVRSGLGRAGEAPPLSHVSLRVTRAFVSAFVRKAITTHRMSQHIRSKTMHLHESCAPPNTWHALRRQHVPREGALPPHRSARRTAPLRAARATPLHGAPRAAGANGVLAAIPLCEASRRAALVRARRAPLTRRRSGEGVERARATLCAAHLPCGSARGAPIPSP